MITLVRHPPVAAAGRCYGRLDLPAAPAAIAELAARLPHGRRVWTSPATRCRAVAEMLGAHRVDERLQELDFGAWEGRLWEEIPLECLEAWASDPWGFAPPGGESGAALVARVRAFAAECADGDVVITHGGPLRVLAAVLRQEPVELLATPPLPGSVTIVQRVCAQV